MSAPREPNPLRPYYIPPSVGSPPGTSTNASTAPNVAGKHGSTSTTSASFGSSARNILADMDCSDYLSSSSPSAKDVVKRLAEQAVRKYTSVFLAQPFEVAKTILQVHVAATDPKSKAQAKTAERMRRRPGAYQERDDLYDVSDYSESGSGNDSQSYFTSSAPLSHTPSRPSRARRRQDSPHLPYSSKAHRSRTPLRASRSSPHTLELKSSSSLIAALSSLWTKEGAWGIWKGTNSTYVYSILLSTITSFSRSLISALLNLPDPGLTSQMSSSFSSAGGIDILSSPSPLSSLAVAVSAAGLAGILLAPLDIARTKLMLTPSTHPPRSILSTLQSLPSWALPFSIAPVTFLHSTVTTFISTSLPLFMRSKLSIEPMLTPTLYSMGTFLGQATELVVKLPLETVLRRGQMQIIESSRTPEETQPIVEFGPYKGLTGTMLHIVNEEGERGGRAQLTKGTPGAPALKAGKMGASAQRKKGQGLEGLWRGWRVGMWGLIGVWGATTLGGVGSTGGEF